MTNYAYTGAYPASAGSSVFFEANAGPGDVELTLRALENDLWVAGSSFTKLESDEVDDSHIGAGQTPGLVNAYLLKEGEVQNFKIRAGDQLYMASGAVSGQSIFSLYWTQV
jgi:hypothetical protein